MSLSDNWYNKLKACNRNQAIALQNDYFDKETEVYRQILAEGAAEFSGTAHEFGEKYGLTDDEVGAFLSGVDTSLETQLPLDDIEADTQISFKIVWSSLYKNMLKAKADWLYTLPEWDAYYTADQKMALTREYRNSVMAHSTKVGRNDPCPCGSGKKYKNCCGME